MNSGEVRRNSFCECLGYYYVNGKRISFGIFDDGGLFRDSYFGNEIHQ